MPKKIKTHLTLHEGLKASYDDAKTAKREMKAKGYYYDKALSNANEKVFYDPKNKKVLMTVKGSKTINDWTWTNPLLGVGALKHTSRFKEAEQTLLKANKKYNKKTTIIGHSLGGQIASELGQENDRVITYNKGAGILGHVAFHPNEKHYRTNADVFSVTASQNPKTIHLKNKHDNLNLFMKGAEYIGLGLHAINAGSIKQGYNLGHKIYNDVSKAHDVNNLKGEKIFI
jgi:hypothetical protein